MTSTSSIGRRDKESGYQGNGRGRDVRGAVWVVLLLLLPGCAGVYRVEVAPDVLARTELSWTATRLPETSGGLWGVSTAETDYLHQSPNGDPPYSGLMQVFSLRGDQRTVLQLREDARKAVANATAAQSITLDESKGASGGRSWALGVQALYFVQEGTVTASGFPFARDARVRILGEVGHDGRSGTSIVVIAMAQIGEETQCPVIGPCQSTTDLRAWNEIAGDPRGSISGTRSDNGLVYNLVTHG